MPILRSVIGLLLTLVPLRVFAQGINAINIDPCPIPGISCNGLNPGLYIVNITSNLVVMFWGVLAAAIIFYGVKLLLGSADENVITEARRAYFYAFFGAALAGGALLLGSTFLGLGIAPLGIGFYGSVVQNMIRFFEGVLVAALVGNMLYQGTRLVIAQDDGQIDGARKRLIHGFIGAAVVILAVVVTEAVWISTPGSLRAFVQGSISSADGSVLASEIAGIARFFATIFGAMAVIGVIASGIYLILSVDESLKDRAKTVFITSIVSVIIVLLSFSLITLFLSV